MQNRTHRFPLWRLLATTLITVATVMALGWSLYYTTGHLARFEKHDLQIERICGRIIYFDEVLTMSARQYVSAGDVIWKQRYDEYVTELDWAIDRAFKLSPDVTDGIATVTQANERLVAMEMASFVSAGQGRLDEAKTILDSDEYASNKKAYSLGVQNQLKGMRTSIATDFAYARSMARNVLFASAVSLVLMVGFWINLSHALYTHITHRRKAEQHLRQTAEQLQVEMTKAQAASMAKSAFLANMSHEIRTPMTAILGYTDMLKESDLPLEQKTDCIRTIRSSGEQLLKIINDILDISAMETGDITIDRKDTFIVQILDEVASLMRARAHKKKIDLEIQYQSPVPQSIPSDPARLRQILINLVGNAIKFTEEGGVNLAVRTEGLDRSDPQLLIEVIDTGIGMSDEQMADLFNEFTQADESMTRQFGGMGLGLAISKRLAGLLGGDITVRSTLREGSCFTLSIATGPLDQAKLHSETQASGEAGSAATGTSGTPYEACLCGRVLLAEDGAINQRFIGALLEKFGLEADLVSDGQAAYDKAIQAHQDGKPYDVILMDIQMPIMDGYTALRKLRADGYEGPIIALTAHSLTEDRRRCLDAGSDDYIAKPVKMSQLCEMLGRYIGAADSRQSA